MIVLTQKRLKELVSYNEETGIFTRIIKASSSKPGIVISKPMKSGYLRMHIDSILYYHHRLAWLYVYGNWPKLLIDHIDGDKSNNKIKNIREANFSENFQNISIVSNAASGLRGAYLDKKSGKWQAKIMKNYKSISAGYYDTAELAHKAYLDAKRKHHLFNPEITR
jgi:hypothetical protein